MLIMRQRQNTRDTTGHTHKNADIGEGDYDYHIVEHFREVPNFMFFEDRAVNAKIKTEINSHAPVFHMQSYW